MEISRVEKERILLMYQKCLLDSTATGYICNFFINTSQYKLLDQFTRYMEIQSMVNTYDRGISGHLGLDHTDFHDDNFEVYQSIRYMVLEHFLDWLDKSRGE